MFKKRLSNEEEDDNEGGDNKGDFWEQVRLDAAFVHEELLEQPIWSDRKDPLGWLALKASITAKDSRELAVDWSFWTNWYDEVMEGKDRSDREWEMLKEIVLIEVVDWEKGPAHINPMIAEIVELYEAGSSSPLSKTSIAEFEFDPARRWLEMVGFDEDLSHIDDPAKVKRFVADVDELKDGLQDVFDFMDEAARGNNAASTLAVSAEKVLNELTRIDEKKEIRARRLITLGGYLYSFSLEEAKRKEIGDTLASMLDTNIHLLRDLCGKHFGPSIESMAPLDALELGNEATAPIVADLKSGLEKIERFESEDLARMDPEGIAVLKNLISQLEEVERAIEETNSDTHAVVLKNRFAKEAARLAATLGRFVEKGRPHAEKAGASVDWLIKQFKRWKTFGDIIEWLERFGSGGPPGA